MTKEVINELKKYTLGRKNTEKVEISVLQLNRVIKALEQEPCDVFDEYGNYKYPSDVELTEPNTATSMPCEDAISRQAVEKITWEEPSYTDALNVLTEVREKIRQLPPVNPQPKTGHWIDIMVGDMPAQACDQCNTFYPLAYTGGGHKYCPNCGAKMVEPQESEDKCKNCEYYRNPDYTRCHECKAESGDTK